MGAKVEFPIGKKLFHLVVNPGTSRCPTILFSEYEPLNKYCYYSLLDTYQFIQGQGTRGTKCLHCRLAKKQTVHWYKIDLEGSHLDLLTGRDRFSCRGPGTGRNYEDRTCKWNTKFLSEIRAHLFGFSSGTNRRNVFHLSPNRKFRKFWLNGNRPHPGGWGRGGGHLGIFWVGMCRPGLQIGTPF